MPFVEVPRRRPIVCPLWRYVRGNTLVEIGPNVAGVIHFFPLPHTLALFFLLLFDTVPHYYYWSEIQSVCERNGHVSKGAEEERTGRSCRGVRRHGSACVECVVGGNWLTSRPRIVTRLVGRVATTRRRLFVVVSCDLKQAIRWNSTGFGTFRKEK